MTQFELLMKTLVYDELSKKGFEPLFTEQDIIYEGYISHIYYDTEFDDVMYKSLLDAIMLICKGLGYYGVKLSIKNRNIVRGYLK